MHGDQQVGGPCSAYQHDGESSPLIGQRPHPHTERMEGVLVLLFVTLLVVFLVTRKAAIKAFSKSYELPPPQDIHEQEQEWPWMQELKNDPTVIWLDDNRYRLADDPEYVSRSTKPIDVPEQFRAESSARSPETKYGPRGGRYTEDRTKDGRPCRRYF